jgi:hypothetical protein
LVFLVFKEFNAFVRINACMDKNPTLGTPSRSRRGLCPTLHTYSVS